MSRRKLSADELDLWNKVAKTTSRIDFQGKPTERKIFPRTAETETDTHPIQAFKIKGQKTAPQTNTDVLPTLSERMQAQPVQMDRKTHTRLKRGKLKPEARIDLHGMTTAQAHPELMRFIQNAQNRQLRLVLVITGKGKDRDDDDPIPVRRGVLRHSVPQWLASGPLASGILQVTEAHQKHGGGGAYYVYLRRARK